MGAPERVSRSLGVLLASFPLTVGRTAYNASTRWSQRWDWELARCKQFAPVQIAELGGGRWARLLALVIAVGAGPVYQR